IERQVFFILLFQYKTEIILNVVQQHDARPYFSGTVTGGTLFVGDHTHLWTYSLSSDLDKSKFTRRKNGMTSSVICHTLLQECIKLYAIGRFVHIDIIDNHDFSHITEAQLSCNFFCSRFVYYKSIIVLVFFAGNTVSPIHVDDVQG